MNLFQRLKSARDAYEKRDLQASAQAHQPDQIARSTAITAEERHGGASSQYLGPMVYGGLDGIVTTFAVVSGVAGAQLSANVVLILGLANRVADGFSMATGAYLASKSEQEYYQREKQREAWEVEHFPDGERAELFELYRNQGYSEEDARTLVDIKSKDHKLWVDAMMLEELQMIPDTSKPLVSAAA